MKKLFITGNGAIKFDTETQEASTVENDRDYINRVYLIDEPTHIIYQVGTTKQEIYAEPEDILIKFFDGSSDFPNKIVVAKSAQWVDNIKLYRESEQKRKEEWALKKAQCLACEAGACADALVASGI